MPVIFNLDLFSLLHHEAYHPKTKLLNKYRSFSSFISVAVQYRQLCFFLILQSKTHLYTLKWTTFHAGKMRVSHSQFCLVNPDSKLDTSLSRLCFLVLFGCHGNFRKMSFPVIMLKKAFFRAQTTSVSPCWKSFSRMKTCSYKPSFSDCRWRSLKWIRIGLGFGLEP